VTVMEAGEPRRDLVIVLAGTSQELEGVESQLLVDAEGIQHRAIFRHKQRVEAQKMGFGKWLHIENLLQFVCYIRADRELG